MPRPDNYDLQVHKGTLGPVEGQGGSGYSFEFQGPGFEFASRGIERGAVGALVRLPSFPGDLISVNLTNVGSLGRGPAVVRGRKHEDVFWGGVIEISSEPVELTAENATKPLVVPVQLKAEIHANDRSVMQEGERYFTATLTGAGQAEVAYLRLDDPERGLMLNPMSVIYRFEHGGGHGSKS